MKGEVLQSLGLRRVVASEKEGLMTFSKGNCIVDGRGWSMRSLREPWFKLRRTDLLYTLVL